MSQKAERPTLQGHRFRTRKRDEKEKFNPTGFRDTILHNFDTSNGGGLFKNCALDNQAELEHQPLQQEQPHLNAGDSGGEEQQQQQQPTQQQDQDQDQEPEAQQPQQPGLKRQLDIDAVIKCLLSDTKIDYRVYGEQLFDIIIAGGILAPGGSILVDSDSSKQYRTDICLFKAVDSNDLQTIENFANIFVRLIQRFGYLEKTLEEEFKKIIVFLKGFEPDDRVKLAKITAVLMSLGVLSANVLLSALQDHLVKDGVALEFLIQVLQTWIIEKDPNTVWNLMRRNGVDNKLLDFLPPNTRSSETIINTFQNNGLHLLVAFIKTKESEAKKSELSKKISALIKNKDRSQEIISVIKESNEKNPLEDSEVIVLIWRSLMSNVEWNKKEELVAEQAFRHLRFYAALMEAFTKTAKAQMTLLVKIQEYCYENMNFLKAFHKIVVLLYKAEVISEDIIIEWYNKGHSNKGKSVFLDQIKPFVDWLTNAEEESDEED